MNLQWSVTITNNLNSRVFPKNVSTCFSYENKKTGVKGGLNHDKEQDISKFNKRHYHLQKKIVFNTLILRRNV